MLPVDHPGRCNTALEHHHTLAACELGHAQLLEAAVLLLVRDEIGVASQLLAALGHASAAHAATLGLGTSTSAPPSPRLRSTAFHTIASLTIKFEGQQHRIWHLLGRSELTAT